VNPARALLSPIACAITDFFPFLISNVNGHISGAGNCIECLLSIHFLENSLSFGTLAINASYLLLSGKYVVILWISLKFGRKMDIFRLLPKKKQGQKNLTGFQT
jgi:hypothetical protein